ncbi:hypothetical protein RhiirC2_722772, partial [Rhizophagus irregularis]
MGIGIDKAYGISYGVREKARDILTNGQEQNHVTEISEKILPIPEENLSLSADVDDYINMLTGDIDDETLYGGTPYENEAKVEKEEVNEVKGVPRVQSDDDVYFDKEVDSMPQPMKEMNEWMPDDSDDDGYGGYNEYGERDR